MIERPTIRVEGLGKLYKLGGSGERYQTLRESLVKGFRTSVRALRRQPDTKGTTEDAFWALRDVSFAVRSGEVVGIVGRNGAGKSTLLKIISRITEPTTGRITLHGRVASLLEVGTGFHPELTGRENIRLNGSILGMSRAEVKANFDSIVAFAEVEKFLDTPVKRYSSGMYIRLAFAVAAHLSSEILIIDEVLAVGDANFQKKCLGKMEELGSKGRTVLFVSHSMPNVHRLCSRVILLEGGRLVADGEPGEVTRRYLHSDSGSPAERVWHDPAKAPGNEVARLKAVRVYNEAGEVAESIDIRQAFTIEVEYWNLQTGLRPTVSLWFVNEEGINLFTTNDFNNREWWKTARQVGPVRAICRVPGNFLAEGQIFILAAVASYNPDQVHVLERDVISFLVIDRSEGDGVRSEYAGHWPGVMRPMLAWDVFSMKNDTGSLASRSVPTWKENQ